MEKQTENLNHTHTAKDTALNSREIADAIKRAYPDIKPSSREISCFVAGLFSGANWVLEKFKSDDIPEFIFGKDDKALGSRYNKDLKRIEIDINDISNITDGNTVTLNPGPGMPKRIANIRELGEEIGVEETFHALQDEAFTKIDTKTKLPPFLITPRQNTVRYRLQPHEAEATKIQAEYWKDQHPDRPNPFIPLLKRIKRFKKKGY